MRSWIRNAALVGAALSLLACSGSARTDFPGEGGGGTGTGTAGGGGVDCNCAIGAYVPVCGIDGTTYDAACGIECVPVEVDCQGECPCVDCDGLQQQYRDTMAAARACSPFIDMEQCTEQVSDQLACPCPTFVNPANTEAVNTLEALRAQWVEQRCGEGIGCPAVECEQPFLGYCAQQPGSGDVGSCADSYELSSGSDSGSGSGK